MEEANAYELERSLDSGETFKVVYSGDATQFTDLLPESAETAIYRVYAANQNTTPWDDIDALQRTADEWNENTIPWFFNASGYTTSDELEVIPNRPPVISGSDSNIGQRLRGFDITYSITDPDPGNTISAAVHLDSTLIQSVANVQQGVTYTASVTDAQVFAMEDGSTHQIIITATDNNGASSQRIYTFTAYEDLISTAVFYIMRYSEEEEGFIPIAKIQNLFEFYDYTVVGTHRYIVRGVDQFDNYADSNEVTVTVSLIHATIAPISAPDDYMTLAIRSGSTPIKSETMEARHTETWYENRTKPVHETNGQVYRTLTVGFTNRTLDDRNRINQLILAHEPLVYRDWYETRIIGMPGSMEREYVKQLSSGEVIDFDLPITETSYQENIGYD